jgi:hypothetical protein
LPVPHSVHPPTHTHTHARTHPPNTRTYTQTYDNIATFIAALSGTNKANKAAAGKPAAAKAVSSDAKVSIAAASDPAYSSYGDDNSYGSGYGSYNQAPYDPLTLSAGKALIFSGALGFAVFASPRGVHVCLWSRRCWLLVVSRAPAAGACVHTIAVARKPTHSLCALQSNAPT